MLRLADINEDGRVDIVSVNGRRNSIEILFGDGRGGFAVGPRVMLDAGGDFYTSDLADVDSDGHLDVVAASGDGRADRVVLKRGDGRGGFGESLALPSTPPRPRVVALADVNGDARIDVVVAHGEIRRLTVLLNRDGRTFTTAAGSPYHARRRSLRGPGGRRQSRRQGRFSSPRLWTVRRGRTWATSPSCWAVFPDSAQPPALRSVQDAARTTWRWPT